MCRVLQVARSGFYQWLHKPLSDRAIDNQRLLAQILASYQGSSGVYGSPRVFLDLREAGETELKPGQTYFSCLKGYRSGGEKIGLSRFCAITRAEAKPCRERNLSPCKVTLDSAADDLCFPPGFGGYQTTITPEFSGGNPLFRRLDHLFKPTSGQTATGSDQIFGKLSHIFVTGRVCLNHLLNDVDRIVVKAAFVISNGLIFANRGKDNFQEIVLLVSGQRVILL